MTLSLRSVALANVATPGFAQHSHDPGDPLEPEELPDGEAIVIPATDMNLVDFDLRQYGQEQHYDHGNGMAVADVDGDDLIDIYFISQLGGNQLW